jgi:hypothetical protein
MQRVIKKTVPGRPGTRQTKREDLKEGFSFERGELFLEVQAHRINRGAGFSHAQGGDPIVIIIRHETIRFPRIFPSNRELEEI